MSVDRMKTGHDQPADPSRMGDAASRANEEQLRALGMGDPQIKELAKKRQVTRDVTVASPMDGIVLSRSITAGQRFENGTEFYRIADLSKVWILADLFGEEARLLVPGTRVKVTVRELSRTLSARVGPAPALFDPVSRTLKLRLEADNPGLALRPDMFVDLEFSSKAPAGLSVPQEAVLDSGLRKIVYLETSDDVFEPQPVETGAAYGGNIVVTKGLTAGDRVVVSGNFLIDSESRLHSRLPALASANNHSDRSSESTLVDNRDPVCGMKLDSKQHQSNHVERYRGELFHFCSDNCQKKFQQEPGRYVDIKVGTADSSKQSRRFDD
jgi:Cu(I)/Ag(I) efflux system membrane fusion protein